MDKNITQIIQYELYKYIFNKILFVNIYNFMKVPFMNIFQNIITPICIIWISLVLNGCYATSDRIAVNTGNNEVIGSKTPYFTPITSTPMAPDINGFLRRWLLLEPINKPNRTNTVFTDSYLREHFNTEYFPSQFTKVPADGDKVNVGEQILQWHALDATGFNVKLFRFATNFDKQEYGVLFWVVTVVESPQEMKNVRLAVGSNSASMWWLNGEEAVLLTGDRRMVMDDFVSKRLTLKKGQNIIRGAVINGPGMSDFCVRFIDEKGDPIKDLTINLGNAGNE